MSPDHLFARGEIDAEGLVASHITVLPLYGAGVWGVVVLPTHVHYLASITGGAWRRCEWYRTSARQVGRSRASAACVAEATSLTQAALSVHSVDESSAATALRSVVLMSQNSSQVTQYASMG